MDRMSKAKRLTAGVVFHSGYGELCSAVYAEVKRRFDNRIKDAQRISAKKKNQMLNLQSEVNAIRQIMTMPNFTLVQLRLPQLKILCRWEKGPRDAPLPTKKADLIKRWKDTMGNTSPVSVRVTLLSTMRESLMMLTHWTVMQLRLRIMI